MTDQRVGKPVLYAGRPPSRKIVGGATGGVPKGGMPVKGPIKGQTRQPVRPTTPKDKGRNSGVE